MSIAEKLTKVAENQQKVYDAGYQKGVSETDGYGVGYGDGQANFGIPNEVTGTGIVTLDYVNENEHNVEVKLLSDTVTDFSGVEVKVVNNQLLPEQDLYYAVFNYNVAVDVTLPKGKYTLYSVDGSKIVCFITNVTDNKTIYNSQNSVFNFELDSQKDIMIKWGNNNGTNLYISDVTENWMLNRGYTKLPYEPYTEKTYTANADGTVDGVTSISPIMNIICDTEGVDITTKYYQCPSAEYDRFWDNYQDYGNRTNYASAFKGTAWNDNIFKPKYPFKPTDANNMFNLSSITKVEKIDFSNCTDISYLMRNSKIEELPPVDCGNVYNAAWAFAETTLKNLTLHNVRKVVNFTYAFYDLKNLLSLNISGSIGTSVNFQSSSLLSEASVQNIIDCLADLTGQTAQTLTFHADVKAKLTEEQIATITSKNWTLA